MIEFITLILALGIMAHMIWRQKLEYKDYCVQDTRQRLFGIRAELFNYAAERNLSFNEKAYGLTRTMLNGYIRFAHEITFSRMIFTIGLLNTAQRPHFHSVVDQWKKSLDSLDPEQKAFIESRLVEAHLAVLSQVVETSFILKSILKFMKMFGNGKKFMDKINGRANSSGVWKTFDFEASIEGREKVAV